MGTFLFNEIVFGPVQSRRLGVSLGINVLPENGKICSFDCIYCECGFTPDEHEKKMVLPSRKEIRQKLEERLTEMTQSNALPDVITFAGNGEPTMHPAFAGIIDDTIALRDRYAPDARVAVLSNATMLHKPDVYSTLLKVEDNILKLDSAFEKTVQLINRPRIKFNLPELIRRLKSFDGKVTIQTLFVKGHYMGETIDNSTEEEVSAWLKLIREISPGQVMIYTIARDTPIDTLKKVSAQKLDEIARKVKKAGFEVQVSY